MVKYFLFILFFALLPLRAFESTNLQVLYSNSFNGDVFIFDTIDGKKTTVTFEHFRTFSYGDFFMFVDVMDGEKFNNKDSELYAEFAPRLSFSKMFERDLSFGVLKDVSVAAQMEKGDDYSAYLYGLGFDFTLPLLNVFSLNVYNKTDNINSDNTYQITAVYSSEELFGLHFEGFVDATKRDFSTQNQVLYNLDTVFSMDEKLYVGVEWLYYEYDYKATRSKTSAVQGMVKYSF